MSESPVVDYDDTPTERPPDAFTALEPGVPGQMSGDIPPLGDKKTGGGDRLNSNSSSLPGIPSRLGGSPSIAPPAPMRSLETAAQTTSRSVGKVSVSMRARRVYGGG
jgi:hypothetical protein